MLLLALLQNRRYWHSLRFKTLPEQSVQGSYPYLSQSWGWSGGAMVLPVPGRPTIWRTIGLGPTAFAVGAGGGCLDIFTLIYPFSPFSLSLGDGPI